MEKLRQRLRGSSLSLAAVGLGLLVGAVLVTAQGHNPLDFFRAIFHGSFDGRYAIGRTLTKATPLVLTGCAVIVGLKAGLFNIGAQGQLAAGAVVGAYAGYRLNLPAPIHVTVALILGAAAGMIPALIAGVLKATRQVHEVISTIMLNTIVFSFAEWISGPRGPWKQPRAGFPRTPDVAKSGNLPKIGQMPLGFAIAVVVAFAVAYVLTRTTTGFRLSTVGANRHAAQYAGMSVKKVTVLAMGGAGALAGLGGSMESLGNVGYYSTGAVAGLGFDGITIALLSKLNARAVIPSALLIGAMRASNTQLQSEAKIAPEIIDVIVAVILLLVAAPMLVRAILRRKAAGDSDSGLQLTAGWGS
jgi:general nucleoside transport system permease protein